MKQERIHQLINELEFKATRSSGPGGQHVNKVSTKIELRFNVTNSEVLSNIEKVKINDKNKNIINSEGELVITDQSSRSQFKNKESATKRFIELIEKALKRVKKRVPTRPTLSSKIRRVEDKKRLSSKKDLRKKDFD